MNPPVKRSAGPEEKPRPPAEKNSTATPEPKTGGGGGGVHSDDWRKQSEPHPMPPGTGPAPEPPAKRAVKRARSPMAAATPPGTPYVADTPITVTPYRAPGNGSFFMVGTVLVGSEEAAAMALKNQLFLPAIPPGEVPPT